jgi:uncharacterized protein YjbI with pentapeptide repeats
MANQEQLEILKQGVKVWNKWRKGNPGLTIDLGGADLIGTNLIEANLTHVNLSGAFLVDANLRDADLSDANLSNAGLINATLWETNLTNANLREADLLFANLNVANLNKANLFKANLSDASLFKANLSAANLSKANLYRANLGEANLFRANLIKANLSRANLDAADLTEANISNALLSGTHFVGTKVSHANISNSKIYGVNVWDLKGEFKEQNQLVISQEGAPEITVDNIKVAQFVYLILNNAEIRGVLNTLTTKSVLILGRFADPSRKAVLDGLRDKLREFNLLPIVFDFERPDDKDYTETVQTLAGLSLFVIVDVTSPKSTPLEMEATVKQFKIPFVPIIDLSVDKRPYAMIVDSQNSFHWVLKTFGYESKEQLLDNIEPIIINRALEKHNELRKQKANVQEILTLADLKK